VEGLTMTTTMTRFGMLAAMAVAMVACGGPEAPSLAELQITPAITEVTENLQASVVATAVYTDGTTIDVTAQVAWSSVDASVASAAGGLVQAGQPGSTYLTASFGGLQTAARVDVIAATLLELRVAAESVAVPAGLTTRVVATGAFSDGSLRDVSAAATWSTTRTLVEVSAGGEVKALSPGWTQVRASVGDLMAAVTMQVTEAQAAGLSITGVDASLAVGQTAAFQVFATFTDGSSLDVTGDATVEVLDAAVAMLHARTSLKAKAEGTTQLRVSYAGFEATVDIAVTPVTLDAIQLTCPATLSAGGMGFFVATGTYSDGSAGLLTSQVTWQSGNAQVAEISTWYAAGAIFARAAGTATITALDPETQRSASCTVTVQ
jgi:hypothetical protein